MANTGLMLWIFSGSRLLLGDVFPMDADVFFEFTFCICSCGFAPGLVLVASSVVEFKTLVVCVICLCLPLFVVLETLGSSSAELFFFQIFCFFV